MIDYTNDEELRAFFQKNAETFDCVYDAATNSGGGEDYWQKSFGLLRTDQNDKRVGHFTALNGKPSKWARIALGWEKVNENLIKMETNAADLKMIVSLLNRTGARSFTNNIVSFDDQGLSEAFKLLKSRSKG